jgi:hypothetical protein
VEQALSALSIPSPTQLTIDICRKHNKKGIKITDAQIKDSEERIKRNKK